MSFGGGEAAGAANIERLHRNAFRLQPADQYVEANAMAADHHKIGEMSLADQLHLNRGSCSYAFRMLFDRNEPVCLTERGDRARTLAGRVGGQRRAVSAANQ